MSTIARIFIVINLLLAALCVGWASNHLETANNFKTQLEEKKTELETTAKAKDDEISTLRVQINGLEQSNNDNRSRADAAEQRANSLAQDNESKGGENAQLSAQVDSFTQTFDNLSSSVEATAAQAASANEAKDEAVAKCQEAEQAKEEALEAKAEADRALREANDMIAALTEEKAQLTGAKSDLETQVAVLRDALGPSYTGLVNTPLINGAVIAVDTSVSPGLVGINKGTADGVTRGFVFEIYSGGQYKGKAKVEAVQANSCAATIVSTYEGRSIVAGDSASTKI